VPNIRIERSMNDNLTELAIGNFTIWYSYETPVALWIPGSDQVTVSENVWSQTTGRHLADLERRFGANKKDRIPNQKFREMVANATLHIYFAVERIDFDSVPEHPDDAEV
jgi:hypothetical protein